MIGVTMGAIIVLSIAAATTESSPYGRFQLAMTDSCDAFSKTQLDLQLLAGVPPKGTRSGGNLTLKIRG